MSSRVTQLKDKLKQVPKITFNNMPGAFTDNISEILTVLTPIEAEVLTEAKNTCAIAKKILTSATAENENSSRAMDILRKLEEYGTKYSTHLIEYNHTVHVTILAETRHRELRERLWKSAETIDVITKTWPSIVFYRKKQIEMIRALPSMLIETTQLFSELQVLLSSLKETHQNPLSSMPDGKTATTTTDDSATHAIAGPAEDKIAANLAGRIGFLKSTSNSTANAAAAAAGAAAPAEARTEAAAQLRF